MPLWVLLYGTWIQVEFNPIKSADGMVGSPKLIILSQKVLWILWPKRAGKSLHIMLWDYNITNTSIKSPKSENPEWVHQSPLLIGLRDLYIVPYTDLLLLSYNNRQSLFLYEYFYSNPNFSCHGMFICVVDLIIYCLSDLET